MQARGAGFVRLPARKTHTYYRYAAIYFAALFLISAVVMALVLQFSATEMKNAETQNTKNSMQQAAELIDKQLQTMQDIALKISMQIDYRPYRVEQGGIYDINLLERFKQYNSYSPLSSQYFLVYRSVEKIYTSAGNTSYFHFYAMSELKVPYERTSAMLQRIQAAEQLSFERFDGGVIAVFPVRFYGYTGSNAYYAALCFVLGESQLQSYISQTTAGLPESYEISVNGVHLLPMGQDDTSESRLTVSSANQRVTVSTGDTISGWALLFHHGGWVIGIGIGVSLLLALISALTMAHLSLRPLDRLLEKYALGDQGVANEFEQLDAILRDLEQSKAESVEQLRNQLLLQMIHGDYSDMMLRRCAMLGISFSHPFFQVCLVEHGAGERAGEEIRGRLKELANEERNVYVAELDEERFIVLVNDCCAPGQGNSMEAENRTLIEAASGSAVFIGQTVEGVKRLPLSYMAALTERRTRSANQEIRVRSSGVLASRLIDAIISGSESLEAQTAEEVRAYLSEEPLSGVMTRFHVYELTGSITKAAEEKGLVIDRVAVNNLVMLSDPTVIVHDLIGLLHQGSRADSQAHAVPDTTARLIVEYVIANAYDPDLDLQAMSSQFGLSADYISNMIKRETGYAFKEYVTILRITEAQRLLCDDKSLTINEVAAMVGYRKSSNFSKKFKELTGVLPSQFRM